MKDVPNAARLTAEAVTALRGFKTHLVAECGLAPNTVAAYLGDVNAFLAVLPAYRDVTLSDVIKYARLIGGGRASVATLNRVLSSLRIFYRYLVKEGEVSASPLEFVPSAKRPERLPDYLDLREVEAIISAAARARAAADGGPARAKLRLSRDVAMLALAYGCGLRASELTAVRTNDVDFNLGVVRVRGKGGRERLVPFGAVARRYLGDYLAVRKDAGIDDPYLFASRRRAGGVSRKLFWEKVKRYAALAGVPAVRPHLLRHTFATHLIQAGADVRAVQELLGHANVATTQIYTHLDTKTLSALHHKFHPRK